MTTTNKFPRELWKGLTPQLSLYISGEVERELTVADFSALQREYGAQVVFLLNNEAYPYGTTGRYVVAQITFPSDDEIKRFARRNTTFKVPGSGKLFSRMLMNSSWTSEHHISVYCAKCDNLICKPESINRVYKDCIWTRKGATGINLVDGKYVDTNIAKNSKYVDAKCSKCKQLLGHRHLDLSEYADYKIFVSSGNKQRAVIRGDQSRHIPLIYPEYEKTHVEKAICSKNNMIPNGDRIPNLPVTQKRDKENDFEKMLRQLFLQYSGVKMKNEVTSSVQDFSIWLWQLAQFEPDIIRKWNRFRHLVSQDFDNNVKKVKSTFRSQADKLARGISGKMKSKYLSSRERVRDRIYRNIGYKTSIEHSDLFNYDPDHKELYNEDHSNSIFLSIDLKHANYTAAYLLNPALVDHKPTFDAYLKHKKLSDLFSFRHFRIYLFGKVEEYAQNEHVKPISEAQSAILDSIYHTVCDTVDRESPLFQRCHRAFKFSRDELMFDLGTGDITAEEAKLLVSLLLNNVKKGLPKLTNRIHVSIFRLKKEFIEIPKNESSEMQSVSFYIRSDLVNPQNQAFKTVMKDILGPVCSHYMNNQQ